MRTRRLASLVLLALSAVWAARASADVTFHVNSTEDHVDDISDGVCADAFGKCTLRAAIMEANLGGAGPYTIVLPAGTYTFTRGVTNPDDHSNGDLDVSVHVTINGAGAATTVIDANHLDRAFKVSPTGYLELYGLTIRNGQPPSVARPADGGAIVAHGNLILDRCVLDSNTSSTYGGAISAVQLAGETATVLVSNTTFSRNSTGNGGGFYGYSNTVFFGACTFWGNSAGGGGGIQQITGSLSMQNTTLYQNTAANFGGGIYVYNAPTKLCNVTLGGNSADTNMDGYGLGGGLYADSTTVTVWNSVFANLNDKTHGNDDCRTATATVALNGGNQFRTMNGCNYTGGVVEVDPLLAALKDNGGPTLTEMLSPSSFALDAGTDGCVDINGQPLLVDQRGVKRPLGAKCDLGAVEVEPIGDANGDGVVGIADVFYVINFLFAGGPAPLGRANVNGGSVIDVADVFYLINFLFAGGPAPV
jgi:CSLREA domain-containing protein